MLEWEYLWWKRGSDDPSIIWKIKSTETEPPHNEVKGEGFISCDTTTTCANRVAWNSLWNPCVSLKLIILLNSISFFILWSSVYLEVNRRSTVRKNQENMFILFDGWVVQRHVKNLRLWHCYIKIYFHSRLQIISTSVIVWPDPL